MFFQSNQINSNSGEQQLFSALQKSIAARSNLTLSLALLLSLVCMPAQGRSNTANTATKSDASQLLNQAALETLVAPIALYPDDLIAIVLPAATDIVGIILAVREIKDTKVPAAQVSNDRKQQEIDSTSAIEALAHYPDVLEKMNADLNWTRALGQATVLQQSELLTAIQDYRKLAADTGFLRDDDYQVVDVAEDTLMIRPRDPQVIYVPDYSPRQVVVYRTAATPNRRAMRYHTRPAPVYYRHYSTSHRYHHTTRGWHGPAFTLSWRNGHIQKRDRYSPNHYRHHRKSFRTPRHSYRQNHIQSRVENHQQSHRQHEKHHNNRYRGLIDHTPRNQYRSHNRRHNEHADHRSQRSNQRRSESRHSTNKQRINNERSSNIQRRRDQSENSRRSTNFEQRKPRAWKGSVTARHRAILEP